jgi:hypothetical protein
MEMNARQGTQSGRQGRACRNSGQTKKVLNARKAGRQEGRPSQECRQASQEDRQAVR